MKGRVKILENNKLIKTDSVWYRINSFFRNLFRFGKNSNQKDESLVNKKIVKNEVDENAFRRILAESLVNGDVVIADLTDKEVDEMIDFFTKDIEAIDRELVRRKENILRMKNNLGERNPCSR